MRRVGLAILFVAQFTALAHAQESTTSEKMLIDAASASTWASGNESIIQLTGPLTIDLDGTHLAAQQAVVWLSPLSSDLPGQQRADIVLLGTASISSPDNHVTRTGNQILVNAIVSGEIQLTAARSNLDMSQSPVFQKARTIRATGGIASGITTNSLAPAIPSSPPPAGGTALAAQPRVKPDKAGEVEFQAGEIHQFALTDDTVAFELSGAVTVTHVAPSGDYLELTASKVILFTSIKTEQMKALGTGASDLAHKITAAYLEGDVRMDFTPATTNRPEQRLLADQTYYDFPTDRAILTGLVLHSIEPKYQIPVIIRAVKAHQLAQGEFTAQGVQLSTSSFAVPTYSVGASYAYIHQENEANDLVNYDFIAKNTTFQAWGTPIFYWPYLSGAVNNGPMPLREFSVGNSSQLGTQVLTQWGLFESLGQTPPKDLDASFRVDERSYRGVGGGFDSKYGGSMVTDTGDPWSFSGDLTSYIMGDKGIDVLGGDRADVKSPTELRGRFLWEHQHFFPDDWQVQVRVGYVSDPNFNEYYYRNDFYNSLPYDASFYVKRQKDTEAITFLAESDTTHFITNADRQQEQFDVQRLPELGYYRIGDSLADDNLTFFSQNTGGRLAFENSHASLAEQGYIGGLSPGLPSDGFTGTNGGQPVYRGDTRQEVDWPVAIGQFKAVPYVMGRVTAYSTSPDDTSQTRLFSGAGLRLSTSFWKVDNSIDSDLFDLHRIRHIVQPELNLFTSGSTVDRSQIYNFDPNVDTINDISGAQVALHQTWETMRGGPGRLRSVDAFELNVEGNFFANQPPPAVLNPTQFRGLFFPSEPETSIPRQGVNVDATWRLGDTTAIFSNAQWNMDRGEMAIADVGIAVSRGDRMTYVLQDSYVQVLDSEVITAAVEYQLTAKYLLQFAQSFNFSDTSDLSTTVSVVRKFDTFAIAVQFYHDSITHDNGFSVNLIPTAFASLAHLGAITGPGGLSGYMSQ